MVNLHCRCDWRKTPYFLLKVPQCPTNSGEKKSNQIFGKIFKAYFRIANKIGTRLSLKRCCAASNCQGSYKLLSNKSPQNINKHLFISSYKTLTAPDAA